MYKLNVTKWLLYIGVDEVVADHPVNWFANNQANGQANNGVNYTEPADTTNVIFNELSQIQKHFSDIRPQFTNNNMLFGDGILTPRIMIIGEAPSADDDKNQCLFSGRSGMLLDQMLLAKGLNRSQVYITNIMPWRGSDIKHDDMQYFANIMKQHINLVQPQSILILGSVSAKLLLNLSGGIMSIRGQVHQYQHQSFTAPTVVTFGLDYLLQNLTHKRQAWMDLLLLQK